VWNLINELRLQEGSFRLPQWRGVERVDSDADIQRFLQGWQKVEDGKKEDGAVGLQKQVL